MRYVAGLLLVVAVALGARQLLVMRSAAAVEPRDAEAQVVAATAGAGEHIRSIRFVGQRAIRDSALLQQLVTAAGATLDPATLAADRERLATVFMDRGYRNAVIGDAIAVHGPSGVDLSIPISAGGRYTLGRIALTGAISAALPELASVLTLRPDQIASRSRMLAAVDALTSYLEHRGVAKVEIRPSVVEHADTLLVDLNLDVSGRI